MQTTLGKLNGTYLVNCLARSYPASKAIWAAVAYADFHEPLIDHLKRHSDVRLKFYGRMDHTGAVSLRLLEWFLKEASPTTECFLVNGAFHPKVIWWRGYGTYIGSANLTRNGWERNIEAGVFLTEEEMEELGVAEQLDTLFDELDRISLRLVDELYNKLALVERERRRVQHHVDAVKRKYDELLAPEKAYAGQTVTLQPHERPSKAEQEFVDEWRSTLQLMRTLCREFKALNRRPLWVPEAANPTVHFDQFLHGYYYHYMEATKSGEKAADRVEAFHRRNADDPARALSEATSWWFGLTEAPTQNSYSEETFIRNYAPRMRALLSQDALASMGLAAFTEVMSHSHAFREHARYFDKKEGAVTETEPEDQKLPRLCESIWAQRSNGGHGVVAVLQFLLYGQNPAEAERRLWKAFRTREWRLPHLGKSILGELLGWARPDEYPPRNNRNNLALRALGYPVETFS